MAEASKTRQRLDEAAKANGWHYRAAATGPEAGKWVILAHEDLPSFSVSIYFRRDNTIRQASLVRKTGPGVNNRIHQRIDGGIKAVIKVLEDVK